MPLPPALRRAVGVFGFLTMALVASAQIVITIRATPTADSLGYSTLQTYNFVFVLNTASNAGASSSATAVAGDHYDWADEFTSDPKVWTSVSGDGLSGTWTSPAAGVADNASHLIVATSSSTFVSPHISGATNGTFQIAAAADQSNIGLTAAGKPVKWLYFAGNFTGLSFTGIGGTLADPNAFLAGFTGTYATSQSFRGWLRTTDFTDAFFTINSLSVAAVVPEPSTWASLLIGLLISGVAAYRRRAR